MLVNFGVTIYERTYRRQKFFYIGDSNLIQLSWSKYWPLSWLNEECCWLYFTVEQEMH